MARRKPMMAPMRGGMPMRDGRGMMGRGGAYAKLIAPGDWSRLICRSGRGGCSRHPWSAESFCAARRYDGPRRWWPGRLHASWRTPRGWPRPALWRQHAAKGRRLAVPQSVSVPSLEALRRAPLNTLLLIQTPCVPFAGAVGTRILPGGRSATSARPRNQRALAPHHLVPQVTGLQGYTADSRCV